jgi:hypothetical protein
MHGDYSKLGPEAEREIQKSLDGAAKEVDFDELGKAAEDGGKKAGARFANGFYRDARGKLRNAKGAFAKESEIIGVELLSGLERAVGGGGGGGGGGKRRGGILGVFSRLGSSAMDAFKSGFSEVKDFGKTVSGVFSKIGDVGGEIGSVIKIAAIGLLIPIAIQLAGALVQLGAALFALPAFIGVAVAAIAPLIIAFQGFGEAVGAGLSGDVDAFNKALKNLTPSAQAVVKEFVKLKPVLTTLKKTVQESFFAPLVGILGPALDLFLSNITKGLSKVAFQLGELGATILSYLSDAEVLGDLNDLFDATARIIERLTPSIGQLFGSFFGLIQTGLPFVEKFFDSFADGIDTFTDWLAQVSGDGRLVSWLQKASDVLSGLKDVALQVGEFLIRMFGGDVGDAGRDFIHKLADAFKELNEYLKTKDGQDAIRNLTTILKAFGAVVLFFIKTEPAMLHGLNLVFEGVRLLLRGLEALGGGFVGLIKVIGDFLGGVGRAIGNFFTKTIPDAFDKVVDFFKGLPGKISKAFSDFVAAGREMIISGLESWYNAVFERIGQIIGIFLSLPYLIQQSTLKGLDALQAAGQSIVDFFVWLGKEIYNFILSIPDLLASAGHAVMDFFSWLWNSVIVDTSARVFDGIGKVIDFFNSIPGKILALGPRVLDAARSIGRKIADGLSEIGNFATDLGKKVTNALKYGINFAIRGINRGIADIDARLPIDLPRLPELADGAIVQRATVALVGEAGPEAVIPLSNPARARELAEESGLTKILRSGQGSPKVTVAVYLDPSGVMIPIARTVVDGALEEQGQELSYGVRGEG